MDFDGFSTNIVDMEAGADDLRRATKRIREITDALETRAAKSFALWESETRTSYDAAKLKWDEACNQMDMALGVGAETVTNNGNNYLMYDRKNAESWSRRGPR